MTLSRPLPYIRGLRPVLDGGDPLYVQDELKRIEQTIQDLVTFCPQEADREPSKKRAGMQRLSRSPWRPVPGQVADAWVFFDGTAWVYL